MRPTLPSVGLVLAFALGVPSVATAYESGSSGADGAFAPEQDVVLSVPPGGVYHFTTVTVPFGVTVTFGPSRDPVVILAQGDVFLDGNLVVSGAPGGLADGDFAVLGGLGGPGASVGGSVALNGARLAGSGFGGGSGGERCTGGGGGGGQNPGTASRAPCGARPGAALDGDVIALHTRGGAGGGASDDASGGGGGGAITIATGGALVVNGLIEANGGAAGASQERPNAQGGGGGGGRIRLIAPALTGYGRLEAIGGSCGASGPRCGAPGTIELAADVISPELFANTSPTPTFRALGPALTGPIGASVRITHVGGATPATGTGHPHAAPRLDLEGGSSVVVTAVASGVRVGTPIVVVVITADGRRELHPSTPCAGTVAACTATVAIPMPRRGGLGALQAVVPAFSAP